MGLNSKFSLNSEATCNKIVKKNPFEKPQKIILKLVLNNRKFYFAEQAVLEIGIYREVFLYSFNDVNDDDRHQFVVKFIHTKSLFKERKFKESIHKESNRLISMNH